MPIIASEKAEHAAFYNRLSQAGVQTIGQAAAEQQEIRAARIGLLNLMPAAAMPATEIQWFRYVSRTFMQVKVVPLKLDNDPREHAGGSRAASLARYTPFSKAMKKGLDALIVTGDNLELDTEASRPERPVLLPFDRITYNDQLRAVLDRADTDIAVGVYSCLGSHIALDHFHGLQREVSLRKISGVFRHRVIDVNNPFTAAMNPYVQSPHSRWGDVPVEQVMYANDVQPLAISDEVGWLALASTNAETGSQRLFLQGHPEYDADDLNKEYQRDSQANPQTPEPAHYYDETGDIQANWLSDARALHGNILQVIYDRAIAQS